MYGKLSFHISHNRLSIAQYLVAMEMMGYLNDQVSFGEYSFAYAKKMRHSVYNSWFSII